MVKRLEASCIPHFLRGACVKVRIGGGGGMEWCDDARIFIALQDLRLVALNARTGGLYPDFGHGGFVDLDLGLGREINLLR